ncbi:unnamed protein product [Staurois parvus]|uniref:Uncharacterized protein n=1 Tax=Staurois parvus TaxID=386267 RepID=A0ABN9EV75_9NEOB|nr:unnamed protein product [Staurois parvus]
MQRINPLGSTVSITSMLYCIYRLILLLQIYLPMRSTMQGRTDHLETRALPEGPGSVGGPMRCPVPFS